MSAPSHAELHLRALAALGQFRRDDIDMDEAVARACGPNTEAALRLTELASGDDDLFDVFDLLHTSAVNGLAGASS